MSLPLNGVKVLDFSTLLPGPYATQIMADMGAEVIKIESPDRHDMVNDISPKLTTDKRKTSYANLSLNRNKQSLMLDLKREDCVAAVLKLVADCDVVVEQFRPGVMKRLGLDYETLKAINPKLIYCSITGYGQDGGYAHKAGHDINYLALSGVASYSGRHDTGPVLSGTQIADIAGGSHQTVMSIMGAIIQRGVSGEGRYIDISMTDAAFSLNSLFGAGAVATGHDPSYGSTLLNGGCFYDYYQTNDDKYIAVGGLEPKFAQGFFQLIERPSWVTRCMDLSPENQLELKADIAEIIGKRCQAYWLAVFTDSDVCVEPVLSVSEAAKSHLLRSRGMVVEVDVDGHSVEQIANPVLRETGHYRAAPTPGEHNQSLLSAVGYSADEIAKLMEKAR